MKAVITAAGLGTRFLPATKAQPKEMLSIIDKPCIQYAVEEALAAGVDEAIVINSPHKTVIEEQFNPNPGLEEILRGKGKDAFADAVHHAGELPVSFIYQPEPNGLGRAVNMAAAKTGDEPFFVLLADVLVPGNQMLQRMQHISEEHGGASVLALMEVPEEQVSRFGIVGGQVLEGRAMRITEMVEKPPVEEAPSNYAIFGRYLLTPKVQELLPAVQPGAGNEIQLTDALVELLKHEEVYGYIIEPQEGYDTGTVETWLTANVAMALRDERYRQAVLECVAAHT